MNQTVNLAGAVSPLYTRTDNISSSQVDQQELRLDRARSALRGLSAIVASESAGDECLMGRRGDLSDLIEIVREEIEAGLTGVRPLL